MLDIKKVQKEAEQEIQAERLNTAKIKIKRKLGEIADAKLIVANLEREYTDLLDEISQGN